MYNKKLLYYLIGFFIGFFFLHKQFYVKSDFYKRKPINLLPECYESISLLEVSRFNKNTIESYIKSKFKFSGICIQYMTKEFNSRSLLINVQKLERRSIATINLTILRLFDVNKTYDVHLLLRKYLFFKYNSYSYIQNSFWFENLNGKDITEQNILSVFYFLSELNFILNCVNKNPIQNFEYYFMLFK